MFRSTRILSLCAAAALCCPATSQAGCLDWLFGCGRSANYCDPCGGGVTTYRPLFPRLGFRRAYYAGYGGGNACCSPCDPCGSPCAQYVPQTTYRACCVNVPVTTCRPVCTCDPCTGCPVTVMRPVTTFVQQVRYTPVVTYRPVCPTTCCSPCADPCGGSHHGYGATTYSPGGSCCNGGATVVPSTVPATVVPSTVPAPMTPVIPNGTGIPQTFQQGSSSSYYRAPAIPANNAPANVAPGAAFDYNPPPPPKPRPGLTTEVPQRTWTFRRVSAVSEQATGSTNSAQADGWRPAKR